jgi:hypothetical protein
LALKSLFLKTRNNLMSLLIQNCFGQLHLEQTQKTGNIGT